VWIAIAFVVAAVGVLPAAAATRTIVIDAMQFATPSLTVRRGDAVVWVNRDLVPHTATAPDGFDSGVIAPGKSWTWRADRPGRFEYVCTLHPTMKARLVVE
jgi:plastocyanin